MSVVSIPSRKGCWKMIVPVALALLACALRLRAATLVQEFFLPLPEPQLYQALSAIQTTGLGTAQNSIYSIVVTGDGTVINYDQWEDGYEINLSSPAQASTQVWGDGNNANGITPGLANDPVGIPAGTVIALTNTVPLPRDPSVLLYDGRDRIGATKALVVVHAGWPVTPGPVFSGAASVLSTIDYGTNYISPVGQDLTNKIFGYVGMFVMAAQDNTVVTIDPDGPGTNAATTVSLNRGESYLFNGGIKKGGRANATKPIQANLIIGKLNGNYAADWFTLYPVQSWDDTYFTPVGSSVNGNVAYVYLYNPNPNALTINYTTRVSAGSFSVPASNGVFQFQMPATSGAQFTSASGQTFNILETVAASPTADTAYNWGFTPVPKDALTTEAVVGWGPGSADGTVNGNPAWVTTLANTTIYVDYKGDRAGPLTDPNGNKYDTNFTVTALQSKTIYDPNKNQSGMRIYTVDGTLLSAAWGQDPDVAAPGNPYIDAGTTVLPFPVPTVAKTSFITNDVAPTGLSSNDVIQYTVKLDNKGLLPLGNIVVIDAPSTNIVYVTNSAYLDGVLIPDNLTGTPFPLDAPGGYTIPIILRAGSSTFTYQARVNGSGIVSNRVNVGGTTISSQSTIAPPPSGGSTSCGLNFTDTNGVAQAAYLVGANVFVTLTDGDKNTAANTVQTLSVVVRNNVRNDLEPITLTETGTNTGIFRNSTPLPTSLAAGLAQQDGILNVVPGDLLTVTNVDAVYGDVCSASAAMQAPASGKVLYLSDPNQALDRIDPVATGDNTTASSVDIGSGGGTGTVTVDASSFGFTASTNKTLTFAHTTGAGANRLMIVGVTYGAAVNDIRLGGVTNVAFGTNILTRLAQIRDNNATPRTQTEIWYLTNPPAITTNVVVTMTNNTQEIIAGAITFLGVNLTNAFGPVATNQDGANTTSNATLVVTSAANELVYQIASFDGNGTFRTLAPAIGQTGYWATNCSDSQIFSGGSVKAGAPSSTNTWTLSTARRYTTAGVSIKPALSGGGGPATNATSFTQTPAFASNFIISSNNTIAITNFITLTNGSLSGTPAITATLRYGSTNIITLPNPTYTAASNMLVWNGTLSSNVTIPSGAAITCVISNGVPNTAFHVDYDSTTKPSKIILPTSTIIDLATLGVYDAPASAGGGNLVISPTAGQTLYVRVLVTDPFGSNDITSLNLVIDGPGVAGDITTTLTNSSVVSSTTGSKTYEYVWITSYNTGGYNIAATANEGTEGITDTAGASVTLTVLDLGTPGTTEFTSGNNGSATNGYPANASVCVRVTDLDQNLTNSVAENLIVSLTSSTGDSQTLALTETSTNTGIFVGCLSTSTNAAALADTNTLYAPVGSVLTVTYTDPNDPSDTSASTAVISPLAGVPGVSMTKTLVAPADGQAGIGETVSFNLQVVNTGSTTLTNVSVRDNYPSNSLSYVSASLAPSTASLGVLNWTNLGNLAPAQITNITVSFTATNIAANALNFATVNGGTVTNTASAGVLITRSAVTVTKSLLAPTNGPVSVNSNVVFRISVRNTGSTSLTNVPLQDSFSATLYQFVSATLTPDGAGAGSLLWTNVGPLVSNAVVTIDVTMKVVGAGTPANNTAIADFVLDSFGNPVPTSTSVTGLVTVAASINGSVYNDLDQSGTLTAGDIGLDAVTLSLYTDPNGDGNPADGALVQLTTSDPSGYYEMLNLSTGRFVVVETDLPGFASKAPLNNRLALNLTNFVASTNNNFFDYQPNATNYASFSGIVWNDANGNATNDLAEAGLGGVTLDLVQDVNTNGLADLGEPVVVSATTDTNGSYGFAGVIPGNYVIRETDRFGYYSTGDSVGANDNQIGRTITAGGASTNNSFFDHFNQSPSATNDNYSTPKNVSVTLDPRTNDNDPDGNALTIVAVSATNGTATISDGTNVLFTPNPNFTGTATIGYTISDGYGGTAAAVITIIVSNSVPVVVNDDVTTPEDVPLIINVLTNDFDLNGDTLTITNVSYTNGAVTFTGTNVTYTPPANYNGTNLFSYVITDGFGGSATGLVTVVVSPVNDLPLANPDGYTVNEDGVLNGNVSTNDLPSGDGGNVWSILVNATHGSVVMSPNGTFTYTPTNNYNGPDSFAYQLCDVNSDCSNATVTITVALVNDLPTANPDGYVVNEDSALNGNVSTNDLPSGDGGNVWSVLTNASHGTVLMSTNGAFTYTPVLDYSGPDSFTYQLCDLNGDCANAIVSINVSPLNDAPTATSLSLTNGEDLPLPITLIGLDVDGPVTNFALVTLPGSGLLTGTAPNLNYQPATNFTGVVSFTYSVNDGALTSSVATVTITITNLNDAPVANSQSLTNGEDLPLPITLTSSDVDGPVTNFTVLTFPGSGLLTGAAPNLTYQPATNFTGTVNFTFTVNDGSLTSSVATVTIVITNLNDAPTATSLSYTNGEDLSLPVTLIGADGDGPVTNFTVLTSPASGSLSGPAPSLTYQPGTNFTGVVSFTYSVNDGSLTSSVATVTITITNINDAPFAFSQSLTNGEDLPLPITLIGSDVDGPVTNFALVTLPGSGLLTGTAPNLNYQPVTNFTGVVSFTYSVNDGALTSSVGTVTITITNLNDAPLAYPDAFTLTKNSTLTVPAAGILTNDFDADGDALTALIVSAPTNAAAFTFSTNGSFTYVPVSNYFGADGFTYRVTDGKATSAVATVSLTILATNLPPFANSLSVTTPEDTSTNLVLTGGDPDGNSITFGLLTAPTNGILGAINPTNGAATYTPNSNASGGDSFRFTVSDSSLLATGTVSITIIAVNDPPLATNQIVTLNEDSATNLVLTGSDVESVVTYAILTSPTNGLLGVLNTNTGAVIYTPTPNFSGVDGFTFTVSDGSLLATGMVSITVSPLNDAPTATSLSLTNGEDLPLPITLIGSDVDGPVTNFTVLTQPGSGLLNGTAPNLIYTPLTNFAGVVSFTYSVNDGALTSSVATVTITITNLNDAPFANSQSLTNGEDLPLPITLTGSDVDGPVTNFTVLTQPSSGLLTGSAPNLIYTPLTNFTGIVSFTFNINDGSLTSTVATVTITITNINDAPTAGNQFVTTPEDTATNLVLVGSDVDSPVTFAILAGPTNGVWGSFNTNTGAITYSPNPNYHGPDSFTFTVSDGSLLATGTVSITITTVNDAPIATNDVYTLVKNATLNVPASGILTNDFDADSDPLIALLVAGPTNAASFNLSPNGGFSYTPVSNYFGADTFTYRVTDGSATSAVAAVSLTILATNLPPFANSQSVSIFEDVSTNLVLTGGDPDATPFSFAILSVPTNGLLGSLNPATGTVTYTPNTNASGGDSFRFTVSDGSLLATGTVSITIIAVNDPPLATNQIITINEDSVTNLVLTGSDVEGPVTYAILNVPTNGVLGVLNTNTGAVAYTPNTNATGSDFFRFTVSDGSLLATGTVTISISPLNDAPVANNDAYSLFKNTTFTLTAAGVLTNDFDADGNPLVALLATNVTHGTLTLSSNGGFIYTPVSNYVGGDSFTYRANDGTTNSGLATVTLTIVATNTAPVANNDGFTTAEDTALTVPASGVLTNDTDIDGDTLTAVLVTNVVHGTLTLNLNGGFLYTPATNYNGPDSFTYRANDGLTNSIVATVNLTITPVNDAPVALNDVTNTLEDVAVTISPLTNDFDVDGNTLTITNVATTNGTVIIGSGTNLVFTPTTNFNGTATLTYTITDGTNTASALITVTVTAVNDVPVANNDNYITAEDTALIVPVSGVLTNDTDVDGDALTAVLVTGPTHGALTLNTNGGFTYTPTNNYNGPDSFTYRANDGLTNSGIATASITVTPVNDAPVAVNDTVTTPEDVAVTIPVLVNDSDVDNDPLSIVSAVTTNGAVNLVGTNLVFTPATNFNGLVTLTYTITDGTSNATALVTVTVTSVNDAPIALNNFYSLFKNTTLTVPVSGVLTNDFDVDGNPLVALLATGVAHGSLTLSSNGGFIYTPASNYIGTDSFTYRANDGTTNSALATVNLTIWATNTAPVAVDDTYPAFSTAQLIVSAPGVLTNDTDADGDALTAALVSAPGNGTVTLNASGSFTYTPTNNYTGPDSFTYRANDGLTNSGLATVNVTVSPRADVVLVKTGAPSGSAGSNMTFTITVTNSGPSTASNVVVFDQLPAAYAFVSAIPAAASVSNNLVRWPATNLPNASSAVFIVTAAPTNGGVFTNIAYSTSSTVDLNPTNNDGSSTNSQVVSTVQPLADIAVFKTGSGSVVAGGSVNYTITMTNRGPSAATNVVVRDTLPGGVTFQSASAGFSLSNGVVSWTIANFANGATSNYTVTIIAPASGSLTNIASSTSGTPDPTPGNNDGSSTNSQATTTIAPSADVAVFKTGATNVGSGATFTYTITVTNRGPSAAGSVVVRDLLPTNLVFVGASAGGVFASNTVTWPVIASLPNGGTTNYTLTNTAPLNGSFTNQVIATSTTADPDASNNNGSSPGSQVRTFVIAGQFALLSGPIVFNPQTGLFEQQATVTNTSGATVAGVQLLVGNIRGTNGVPRTNVFLYNASGTNIDGRPFVQYNSPLNPAATVTFTLEFYVPDRKPFTNTLEAQAFIPPPAGTNAGAGVLIDRTFMDLRIAGSPRFVIEWTSVPGKTYTIIYSDTGSAPWFVATPSVTANANRVQWYDDGPPKTASNPMSIPSRFYRVIVAP